MSEIKEIQCDVKGCKNRNAKSFSIFKERKSNGIDTEGWDYVFDLCPLHIVDVLQNFCTKSSPQDALILFNNFNIEQREA